MSLVRNQEDDWTKRETWPTKLRVRTRAGTWRSLHSVLLPGAIAPGDGSRDDEATVDTHFHEPDEQLLRTLGATDGPHDGCDLSSEQSYMSFRGLCRRRYSEQDDLPHNPSRSYLDFNSAEGVGPLDVLAALSAEGNALYTDALAKLAEWLAVPWLPPSVEERIARSADRTRRIVEAYGTHVDPEWPTLIFATSVEHGRTVAALLNRRGIRSRAVSAETETATRRRVVEEFRRGKVRALVNHGVFREGFDAPKTRAIIVARPVYRPNLYFQMIGRGLRGPLNGGDERCLILNVQDNIESFDRKLAFSELDWLWA